MENSEENYLPREIKLLVIHCSATRCNVSFTVEQLRQCHLQRGFKDIGYHFYITRNGELHHCRPVSEPGAHVRGFNRHSIGICYERGLDEQ
ncbi:N-acetylmuramoyl-L-alanine amidase, partial [Bacteroides ovatus]